ncbi:MAG: alkaline phosphatase D family protein [Verrucomicrobiota bacterium]
MDKIAARSGITFFRCLIEIPISRIEQRIDYKVSGGRTYQFSLPGAGTLPRFAYASCNGFHSTKTRENYGDRAAVMWNDMLKENSKRYHALILGGDQVYSDAKIEAFLEDQIDWNWTTRKRKKKATKLTKNQESKLKGIFSDLYIKYWQKSNAAMMEMLASCPTMMMWDDHDIIDGWGSLIDDREKWPVYQVIYNQAREAFLLFQQHCKPDELPGGAVMANDNLTYGHRCESAAVLNLDTRTNRTRNQIMSAACWKRVNSWIGRLPDGVQHLFVCVSSPLIYADLHWIENLLNALPGDQIIEDDLRDLWRSRPHQSTRLKLLETLFSFSKEKNCRVTLVSGDVHVAAHGIAELRDGETDHMRTNRIHQLISSPIVNQPGNRVMDLYLNRQGQAREHISPAISAEMVPLDYHGKQKTSSYYYLNERNWLSLIADAKHTYRAEWHFEGSRYPCKKEINICGCG